MSRKKYLITGVAGFIGSNLLKHLLSFENIEIIGFDNFDNFYSRKIKEKNLDKFIGHKRFTFIQCDIINTSDLYKINDIDVIIHLAGKAGVRPSLIDPMTYYDVNVKGTLCLLEFARIKNVKQFIFASSSSVYGNNNNYPWVENDHVFPISPYASTKLSAELLGHVYSKLYGLRFIGLRFFTVYGPSQRPDLAIYRFFNAILSNQPITLFGDGSTSRDYTFIDDIIMGIIGAIDYTDSNFEIINLGNNFTVSLIDLIDKIEKICGKKAVINLQPEQLGDVKKTCADIRKASKLLKYNPQISIDKGLYEFYEWFRIKDL